MKVLELRPMLWTEDLKGTVDFYVDTLGFTCNEFRDDWGWTSLSLDDAGIMFTRPNEHIPYENVVCTGSFYFNVEDVAAWWEKLKDKAEVSYGIENFEHGMREFAIYDNNGYMLQFGQEIIE